VKHATELLTWFGAQARDLPWRRNRDAYGVWISEAMLQQTRVETVVPYFGRFMERFPTIAALAAASEEEVVAAWSGLGYYRRARDLRAAAIVMVKRHDGRFPATKEDALALPGVGRYTAGAVLSIAYGLSEPVVDGNVARVFARLWALEAPLGSTALTKALWLKAEEVLQDGAPGAWNQALMELGATVCTPRKPACERCPLAGGCEALARDRVADLPVPAPRREPLDVRLEIALVERDGEVLLERRSATGRMASMWELPTREVPGPDGDLAGLWPGEFRASLREGEVLGTLGHGITHHRIRASVRVADLGGPLPAGLRWAAPETAQELGLTGMARKVLRSPFALERLAPGL
jgi:A/G-specific adenine glycosylase